MGLQVEVEAKQSSLKVFGAQGPPSNPGSGFRAWGLGFRVLALNKLNKL